MLAVDPRRYRPLHLQALRGAEERGDLPQRLHHPFPDEERADGRPAKTSPIYDKLDAHGRGLGPALWLGAGQLVCAEGVERRDRWSFRRTQLFRTRRQRGAAHARAGRRHRPDAVHQARGQRPRRRGLARQPGRQQGADQDRTHRAVPRAHQRGGIRSEFTITKIADRHLLCGQRRRRRALRQRLLCKACCRATARSALRNITASRGCFVVAGPRSREVLAKLTDTPLDNAAFPWLTGQIIEVGSRSDVYALRVNFVGALGWELHFPIEYAHHIFDALFDAGKEHGIGMVGMRAMESLRMEKSYRMWGTRHDAGLHAVRGEPRSLRAHEQGRLHRQRRRSRSSSRLACRTASSPWRFTASRMRTRWATSRCSISGGKIVGRATSGYYGHCAEEEPRNRLRESRLRQRSARSCRSRSWASASRPPCCPSRRTIRRTTNCAPEEPWKQPPFRPPPRVARSLHLRADRQPPPGLHAAGGVLSEPAGLSRATSS